MGEAETENVLYALEDPRIQKANEIARRLEAGEDISVDQFGAEIAELEREIKRTAPKRRTRMSDTVSRQEFDRLREKVAQLEEIVHIARRNVLALADIAQVDKEEWRKFAQAIAADEEHQERGRSSVEWPKAPDTARQLPGEDFFRRAETTSDALLGETGLAKRIARLVDLTSP